MTAEVIQRSESATAILVGEIGGPECPDADTLIRQMGTAEDVNVFINSSGGDGYIALALHDELKKRNAVAYIGERCASAAVFVACGCREIVLQPDSRIMLHSTKLLAFDDADGLRRRADFLDSFDVRLTAILSERTGLPTQVVQSWCSSDDFWIPAAKAVKLGLADRIAEPKPGIRAEANLTPIGVIGQTQQEQLFHEMLRCFGTLPVRNKQKFLRELGVFATHSVIEQ